MKEPKGFASFLGEEKKKKPAKKASPKKSKTKQRKAKGGKDDEKYISMMEEYNRTRGRDMDMADKVFKAAIRLMNDGDVSDHAIEAGHYV